MQGPTGSPYTRPQRPYGMRGGPMMGARGPMGYGDRGRGGIPGFAQRAPYFPGYPGPMPPMAGAPMAQAAATPQLSPAAQAEKLKKVSSFFFFLGVGRGLMLHSTFGFCVIFYTRGEHF